MKIYNCTKGRLTGADRRSIARVFRTRFRRHRRFLMGVYGSVIGAELAREIRRSQEKHLVQVDTDGSVTANGVWRGLNGALYVDGAIWKTTRGLTWAPVIKV